MQSEENANVGTERSSEHIHMLLLGFIVGRESREAKSIVQFIKDLAISRGEWQEWLASVGDQAYMLESGELEEAEEYYKLLEADISEEKPAKVCEEYAARLPGLMDLIIHHPAADQLESVTISNGKLIMVFEL